MPSRRFLLTAVAGAAFAACGPARRQSGSLTYLLSTEPDTLDPSKTPGGSEVTIMSALFEPLLQPDPETMAPVAGLATHYKVEREGTRYTFYLRGHPAPEGIVLADAEPARFSHGAPPRVMFRRAGVTESRSRHMMSSVHYAGMLRR